MGSSSQARQNSFVAAPFGVWLDKSPSAHWRRARRRKRARHCTRGCIDTQEASSLGKIRGIVAVHSYRRRTRGLVAGTELVAAPVSSSPYKGVASRSSSPLLRACRRRCTRELVGPNQWAGQHTRREFIAAAEAGGIVTASLKERLVVAPEGLSLHQITCFRTGGSVNATKDWLVAAAAEDKSQLH